MVSTRGCQKVDSLQIWRKEDLQEIIDNKDSKQTKAVIENSVGIFRSYCESKKYVFSEVEKYNDSEMSSLLRKLYAEVRTKSGDTFSICLGPISKIVIINFEK